MLVILIGASFLFAFIGTRWLAVPGNPLSSADLPNDRSLHVGITPRGGGLSIVAALLLVQLVLSARGEGFFPGSAAVAGFFTIALVSFWDDRVSLPSWLRFLIHFGAAGMLYSDGLRWEVLPLPGWTEGPVSLGWFALPATLMATVWFTNLYNFMDGMDGFSGGMTVFGFGGVAWLAHLGGDPQLAVLSAVTAASAAGFLVWNFPPARIFMGDVAAAPLGFLVAVVSFRGVASGCFDIWAPVILFAPFWFDATVTLFRRALRRERFWKAHRSHAYQRLVQAGWGHRRTTLTEYVLMASMLVVADIYVRAEGGRQGVILLGLALALSLLWLSVRLVERRGKV